LVAASAAALSAAALVAASAAALSAAALVAASAAALLELFEVRFDRTCSNIKLPDTHVSMDAKRFSLAQIQIYT